MPYAHSNHILQPDNVIQNVSLGLRHATLSLKLCTFAVTEFLKALFLLAQIRALTKRPLPLARTCGELIAMSRPFTRVVAYRRTGSVQAATQGLDFLTLACVRNSASPSARYLGFF